MTPFHGLSLPEQVALTWLVQTGGRPFVSDLPALHGLAADGYARHDADDGTWRPTCKGLAVWHRRHEPLPWGTADAGVTDPFHRPKEAS